MLDKRVIHRLIGAGIILVSVAIILPQILDGERPPELNVQVEVSKPPAFPEVKIAPAQSLDSFSVAEEGEPAVVTNSHSVGKAAQDISLVPESKKVSIAAAPQKVPVATTKKKESENTGVVLTPRWTVQIATFAKEANATRLVTKLKKANYPAYNITTNSLYKVFVGPELERDASEKVQKNIRKQFSLKGIVVKFSEN